MSRPAPGFSLEELEQERKASPVRKASPRCSACGAECERCAFVAHLERMDEILEREKALLAQIERKVVG